MDRRIPAGPSGRNPLAVIVVDAASLVSHWSTGASGLFGRSGPDAVGSPATDLLPVVGALDEALAAERASGLGAAYPPGEGFGSGPDSPLGGGGAHPTAGRARLFDRTASEEAGERVALDVLWWAYPLTGPGPERLLVLAADASLVRASHPDAQGVEGTQEPEVFERIAPGFGLHTEFAGSDQLAKRLPEILPGMNPSQSARIVAQVLELGYPVLEISRHDRVPVTPDWDVPRRVARQERRRAAEGTAERAAERAAAVESGSERLEESAREEFAPKGSGPGGLAPKESQPEEFAPGGTAPGESAPDVEYAAAREHLEFLNAVSGSIGTSLDLALTVKEVGAAVVPRFTDVAVTYLREQVPAGEGFPDGPPDVSTP